MHQQAKWSRGLRSTALWFVVISCAGLTSARMAFAGDASPAGPSGYHLVKTIPVPGNTFWDYLKFDPATGRLFISHGDHVAVVDVATGKLVGEIGGMTGIHGIVLAPEFNRGFVTDGQSAKIWIFDLKTLQVTGSTPGEPRRRRRSIRSRVEARLHHERRLEVLDRAGCGDRKSRGPHRLGRRAGIPVTDGRGHIYANIASTSEIVEIDSNTMKITHRWPLAPAEHPSGLAIDTEHRILFSGCRNKLMAVVNADTGKVIATLPIGQGVDATRFDPGTQYAFASNGDGTLTVIHEDSPDKFTVVENVATEAGARTMALDPKTHDIFLVTAKLERIENPPPHTRPFRLVPDTFHVLVFGKDD